MRDLAKVTAGMNKRHTLAAAAALRGTGFPLLLAWAPGDRFFPIRYAERLAAEVGGAKLVEIPDSATFVPLDQPERLAAQIADLRLRRNGSTNNRSQNPQSGTFSSDGGVNLHQTPYPGRKAMSKQIFDQDRPRSTMARLLDEAFAGCDEWTIAPPVQRRSTLDFRPRIASSSRILGRADAVRSQEFRAL